MNKQEEEQRVFDMAKQDVPLLRHLELVKHDDRPDFILKDKNGRKIGLEHFRADIYRVQDKNSSHISGGHTILNNDKNTIFQKYNPIAVNNSWTDKNIENASNELFSVVKKSLDMRKNYKYEEFLDNLRVGIHGKQSKPKGHIQKSKNYPDRKTYDLMGFLIEIPIPSFEYCFKTKGYFYQKINGLPITNEIWNEINIFDDIDFIIIETYNEKNPQEHHGQYFDKNTPKPTIYPSFSLGFTEVSTFNIQTEYKDGKIHAKLDYKINYPKPYDVITKTWLKTERRKQNRKTRKHFDKATKNFWSK